MQESIVFLVRVQCRRKESSRSLSHLLMSFLLYMVYIYINLHMYTRVVVIGDCPLYCIYYDRCQQIKRERTDKNFYHYLFVFNN